MVTVTKVRPYVPKLFEAKQKRSRTMKKVRTQMVTVTKVRPYVPKLFEAQRQRADVFGTGLVSYTHLVYPVIYPVISSHILANASYMEWSFVAREAEKKPPHTHTQRSSCVRNHERL